MAHARRVLLVCFALVLLGCPSLTRPVESDPGYGSNSMGLPGPPPLGRPKTAATAGDEAEAEGKIRASHILVGWKGSAGPPQVRSKEEARKRIEDILARARNGEDFARLAAEFGEDGTKTRGGDLGLFDRSKMDPTFTDAAFKVRPGELSSVVETKYGFHIIKRTK